MVCDDCVKKKLTEIGDIIESMDEEDMLYFINNCLNDKAIGRLNLVISKHIIDLIKLFDASYG